MAREVVWPMPVAMAAPFIPSAGKKPMPKIRNGSRIILVTQPHIILTMDTVIFPTAWKIFSNEMAMTLGSVKSRTILEY